MELVVILLLEEQGPSFEVGEVVLRGILGSCGRGDGLDRRRVGAILHSLSDLLVHSRHIGLRRRVGPPGRSRKCKQHKN